MAQTDATDTTSSMLPDWYKAYMKDAPQAQTYTPSNATASTWTPDTNSTVQGQLTKVLDTGGPLMQRAETRAKQSMLDRGLLNSSIAIGAGQSALYDAATPIATSDANTFADAGKTNAQLGTQVSVANAGYANDAGRFNAGAANDLSGMIFKTGTDYGLQAKQQTFQTGERVAQNTYAATQAALDKEQQSRIQQLQEQGMDKRQAEQVAANERAQASTQTFQSAQTALDREQQSRVQQLQEAGMDARQAKQLASQEALTKLGEAGAQNRFDAQQALQSSQFDYQQNAIDRRMIAENEQRLNEMGYQSELNKQSVPTTFAANISSVTMSAVNAITADGNLTEAAKKAAIQNVIDNGNATLRWASTAYNVAFPPIPGFATPAAKTTTTTTPTTSTNPGAGDTTNSITLADQIT